MTLHSTQEKETHDSTRLEREKRDIWLHCIALHCMRKERPRGKNTGETRELKSWFTVGFGR